MPYGYTATAAIPKALRTELEELRRRHKIFCDIYDIAIPRETGLYQYGCRLSARGSTELAKFYVVAPVWAEQFTPPFIAMLSRRARVEFPSDLPGTEYVRIVRHPDPAVDWEIELSGIYRYVHQDAHKPDMTTLLFYALQRGETLRTVRAWLAERIGAPEYVEKLCDNIDHLAKKDLDSEGKTDYAD